MRRRRTLNHIRTMCTSWCPLVNSISTTGIQSMCLLFISTSSPEASLTTRLSSCSQLTTLACQWMFFPVKFTPHSTTTTNTYVMTSKSITNKTTLPRLLSSTSSELDSQITSPITRRCSRAPRHAFSSTWTVMAVITSSKFKTPSSSTLLILARHLMRCTPRVYTRRLS